MFPPYTTLVIRKILPSAAMQSQKEIPPSIAMSRQRHGEIDN